MGNCKREKPQKIADSHALHANENNGMVMCRVRTQLLGFFLAKAFGIRRLNYAFHGDNCNVKRKNPQIKSFVSKMSDLLVN